ncbi:MAG: preprotein translocase subunit SecG, partial [Planctomycetota bacterium]
LLIGVVLIQDSKSGGLAGAFGGAGGETLLGAGSQKDITRFTSILSVVFLGLCILAGILSRVQAGSTTVSPNEIPIVVPAFPEDVNGGAPPGEKGGG